jgi:hypothetical protein
MQPCTDLLRGELRPLPLLTRDDDPCSRNTSKTGNTENLPKLHYRRPFRE